MPERTTFQGDGVRLVADRFRPDGPARGAVLLLHGGGQTRHSWKRTGDRLAAAGWDALALDSRGHGESDWHPEGRYGLTSLVGDVVAVAGQLGAGPVVLVGASMGGLASLVAAGEHPDVVRALVLVDIVPRIEDAGVAEITTFMRSGSEGFASLEEAAVAVAAYTPERTRAVNLDGLRKNLRQRADGRWYWHWDPAMFFGARDLAETGPQARLDDPPGGPATYDRVVAAARLVTAPTLVVRGLQSRVVSEEGVRELLDLIRHAESSDVGRAGHMIAGDDNDVFAAGLVDFLDRVLP